MEVGKRVKELREERGITISALAANSGLSGAAVSRIERGLRSPGAETVEKLAKGLGVDPGDLFPKTLPSLTPRTYTELLEQAGAEGSGLERPLERNEEGNILTLFEGLSYREAYDLYQRIKKARLVVNKVVQDYLDKDLPQLEKTRLQKFDSMARQRSMLAFAAAYAALEDARTLARAGDDDASVAEIEDLEKQLVEAPG